MPICMEEFFRWENKAEEFWSFIEYILLYQLEGENYSMTAPHIPPDNHKVAVTRGRSLGGQGVGIEKFCESGRCEEQDTPPL